MWIYPVIALKVIVHIFLIFFKAENGNKRSVFGAFWLEISPANCGDAAAAGEEADQLNCFEHSPQNPSHAAISTFSPDFTEFPPELFEISQFLVPSLFSRAWGENQERSGTYERAAGVLNWTRAIEGPCRKAWTAQSVLFHPPPPDLPTTLCRQLGRLRATLGLSEHSGGVGSDFSNNVELGAIQNEIWFLKWKCLEFQFVDTKMLLLSKSTQSGNSAASHLKINWVFQYKFCKHHNCSN